jgi:Undecaprenyl-phosphate glucose phosphotransferase
MTGSPETLISIPCITMGCETRARQAVAISPQVIAGIVKLLDFSIVLGASIGSLALYQIFPADFSADWEHYAYVGLMGAVLFVVGFQRSSGYDFKRLLQYRWQWQRAVIVWAGSLSILLLLGFIVKLSSLYSRGWALSWAVMVLGLLMVQRTTLHYLIRHWMHSGHLARHVAIVGAGSMAAELIAKLQNSGDENIVIAGVFDDRKTRLPPTVCGIEIRGTIDDLLLLARRMPVDEIIVALPLSAEARLKSIFDKLRLLPVDLRLSAESLIAKFPLVGISHIGDTAILEISDRPLKHWSGVTKWVEDVVLGTILLILAGPVMLIVAALVKLTSPGPVFFVQERFGFNNQVIHVLKFRTMYVDRGDASGAERTVRNDPRVTPIGRFLRAYSLDELPQCINVVKGDMSLVGPRPHAITMRAGDRLYHDAVEEYLHRHRVKPGITGWAQVNGLRGEIDTLEKASQRVVYDLDYIENWTIWLDIKILLLSFRVLLSSENAY